MMTFDGFWTLGYILIEKKYAKLNFKYKRNTIKLHNNYKLHYYEDMQNKDGSGKNIEDTNYMKLYYTRIVSISKYLKSVTKWNKIITFQQFLFMEWEESKSDTEKHFRSLVK